jgi:ribose transport system ATP-binding protein
MDENLVFQTINLRKEFGPTVALKSVGLGLRRGEIHGLIGENGSGKSTIMSIAASNPLTRRRIK